MCLRLVGTCWVSSADPDFSGNCTLSATKGRVQYTYYYPPFRCLPPRQGCGCRNGLVMLCQHLDQHRHADVISTLVRDPTSLLCPSKINEEERFSLLPSFQIRITGLTYQPCHTALTLRRATPPRVLSSSFNTLPEARCSRSSVPLSFWGMNVTSAGQG